VGAATIAIQRQPAPIAQGSVARSQAVRGERAAATRSAVTRGPSSVHAAAALSEGRGCSGSVWIIGPFGVIFSTIRPPREDPGPIIPCIPIAARGNAAPRPCPAPVAGAQGE